MEMICGTMHSSVSLNTQLDAPSLHSPLTRHQDGRPAGRATRTPLKVVYLCSLRPSGWLRAAQMPLSEHLLIRLPLSLRKQLWFLDSTPISISILTLHAVYTCPRRTLLD